MRLGLLMGTFLALAACSSPEEMGDAIAGERDVELTVSSTEDPRPVDFESNDERGGGTRDFAYSWPAEVSAIADLAAMLREKRDQALAEQEADWEEALAEFAGEECASCKARGFTKSWSVAADTPRFLSLEGETSIYAGGAHPNSTFDALVWDRKANAPLAPGDLFTSPRALSDAVRAPYCEALLDQRRERLGGYFSEPPGPFENCPAMEELVLVPASSGGEAIDEIRLLAAPYVAGSYAEGPYTVTLPVTRAVVDAVKEEYRDAFAAP